MADDDLPDDRARVTGRLPAALMASTAVLLLAAATVLANRVLPGWAYPVCGVVTSAVLVALAWAAGLRWPAIGFDRQHLRRATVVGLFGAGVVAVLFGVALAVPALRVVFQDGRVGSPGAGQVLWLAAVRIPLGTVLLEEVAFRGVLPALFGMGERWRWGPVLAVAALFGLWHLLPSLAVTRNAAVSAALGGASPVLVSVLAMLAAAAVGVLLHWCRHAGRGVLAPMVVHLATNSGGLLAAWWALSLR